MKKPAEEKDPHSLLKAIHEKLSSPGVTGSDIKNLAPAEEWRPRIELDENGGFLVSTPRKDNNADSKEILREFNLDPNQWAVVGVRTSRWQKHDEDWLTSYRLTLVPKAVETALKEDVEKIKKKLETWKPSVKPKKRQKEGLAFVLAPSDQQIGKKASGTGTDEIVERILDVTEKAVHRYKELETAGRPLSKVVIALLGDHVEGNTSQNGKLQSTYASDIGLTEQIRVARRVLLAQIKAFSEVCPNIVVAVVNGNHDEVTRQINVDPAEGWNTEIVSAVSDVCREVKELSKVEFRFPQSGHQTLALDVNGTMLGLFHGHQMKSGGALKYISGQAAGNTPLGRCDVWLSGHYHHFRSEDIGQRFWAQCPTLDGGSGWFRDRVGLESEPGLLTMVLGEGHSPKQDISIISTKC
jgi:predicted phosphodiesterase